MKAKIAWLVYDPDYPDEPPTFHTTEPDKWHTVVRIVYFEIEESK